MKIEAEYLEAVIRRFNREHGVHRVLWVKCEPAVPAGQNYLSTVTRVKAGVILGSGKKRIISVVMKSALEEGAASQWMNQCGAFNCEIKTYSQILHKMNQLMIEFNDKRDKLWADLIDYNPTTMIFEDLKEYEFKLCDRTKCLDLAHSKLAIRSLARLHAMSRVLLKRKYILPDDLRPYQLVGNYEFINKVYANGIRVLAREMSAWGPAWTDIRERLIKVSDKLPEILLDLVKPNDSNFNVINHGDSWICNIMYKYDDYENIPISLRFVDYQFSHYNSYALDLTYLLYTSLLGDIRRSHFNELLNDYAETLRNTLMLFNYTDEEDIPTVNDVKQEMERLNFYALPLCLVTHPVMTMPVDNTYNFDEALHPEIYENCGFNVEVFKGRYPDEIGPDIIRFAEIGII